MRMFKKGQGATEYLLMLAAVLVIVAIAVYYVVGVTPAALISGTATSQDSDNVVLTPASEMTPSTIPAADWEYAVYRDATVIVSFTDGTASLERGIPVTLSASGVDSGDTLKIRYKGDKVFDITVA